MVKIGAYFNLDILIFAVGFFNKKAGLGYCNENYVSVDNLTVHNLYQLF